MYFIKSDDYSSSQLDQNYSLSTVCISLLRPTQVGVLKFHLEIDSISNHLHHRKHSLNSTLQCVWEKPIETILRRSVIKIEKLMPWRDAYASLRWSLFVNIMAFSFSALFRFFHFFVGWRMIFFPRTRSSLCNNVKFNLSMKYPQATPLIMWIVDSLLC